MATKRLPPPLVGGIQQATIVIDPDEETDEESEDEEGTEAASAE
jgi:hypothetical protein